MYMKAALVLGAVMASPFMFYFIWSFVAAGLVSARAAVRAHLSAVQHHSISWPARRWRFSSCSSMCLEFLLWFYEWMDIDPELRISDWLSFVLFLPLGFGISFQLPLVMLFLERIGIFTWPRTSATGGLPCW